MITDGILSTIGDTPLLPLRRIFSDSHFRVYAKLEAFNPGGSIKDRAAISILNNAERVGEIGPGSTVIESSSGNMGIGLAQACAYLGLRFICVVDPKTTAQNINILKAYGAEVDVVTEPDPASGEFLQARINRVKELLYSIPNSYCPNQYSNTYNARAHYYTMQEIANQMDGRVDYLFCAASTCGTIRGCVEFIRENGLPTKVYAVDAVGSVIFGGSAQKRLLPGHGAARRPELYQPGLADRCVYVTDLDCVKGCRNLVKREAILAGGSSGGVIKAIEQVRDEIQYGARCAAILPDRGERYMDTIYCDEWVRDHFGGFENLYADEYLPEACMATA